MAGRGLGHLPGGRGVSAPHQEIGKETAYIVKRHPASVPFRMPGEVPMNFLFSAQAILTAMTFSVNSVPIFIDTRGTVVVG